MNWLFHFLLTITASSSGFLQDLFEKKETPCPTCSLTEIQEHKTGNNLLVFMSFSVPIETWKDLSSQLEKTEGSFVINGMPGDSFEELLFKLAELRLEEIEAPVDINPDLFEKYKIDAVPAFVLEDGTNRDRIVGNIRLDAAMKACVEKGDATKRAREILNQLEKLP